MALRKPLEAHFEHFSILFAKWPSEAHFDNFWASAEALHPRATESGVFYGVFENKFLESPVDCDFVCTGARQTGPEKSSAQGTRFFSFLRTYAPKPV